MAERLAAVGVVLTVLVAVAAVARAIGYAAEQIATGATDGRAGQSTAYTTRSETADCRANRCAANTGLFSSGAAGCAQTCDDRCRQHQLLHTCLLSCNHPSAGTMPPGYGLIKSPFGMPAHSMIASGFDQQETCEGQKSSRRSGTGPTEPFIF